MREHAEKQMKNKVRLRSPPPEKLHEVLNEKEMMEVNRDQPRIMKMLNNPAKLPSFDVTLNIHKVLYLGDNTYELKCTLHEDNNKNFELVQKATSSKWSNSTEINVKVINAGSKNEYWKITQWYYFICSAGLKWTEIKKILQRNNEKKEKNDPTKVRFDADIDY